MNSQYLKYLNPKNKVDDTKIIALFGSTPAKSAVTRKHLRDSDLGLNEDPVRPKSPGAFDIALNDILRRFGDITTD